MIRSSRHGIPDTHFFLLRHGPSPGAHGGTRGTGIHGITEHHGTGIHGTADSGGILGTGTRGIGIRGITGRTGHMTITGTITTITIQDIGITDTITDAMFISAPGTPPVHSVRGHPEFPGSLPVQEYRGPHRQSPEAIPQDSGR